MTFLDTSALVALFDAKDNHHRSAAKIWSRLRSEGAGFVLTDLIVVETVTLIRRRIDWTSAKRAGQRLLSGAVAEIVFADASLFDRAWQIFCKYDDHLLSLTDCVSFALMRERALSTAFAFDDDFRIAGFELA
jgi:predicted nucleic acid-binding protein